MLRCAFKWNMDVLRVHPAQPNARSISIGSFQHLMFQSCFLIALRSHAHTQHVVALCPAVVWDYDDKIRLWALPVCPAHPHPRAPALAKNRRRSWERRCVEDSKLKRLFHVESKGLVVIGKESEKGTVDCRGTHFAHILCSYCTTILYYDPMLYWTPSRKHVSFLGWPSQPVSMSWCDPSYHQFRRGSQPKHQLSEISKLWVKRFCTSTPVFDWKKWNMWLDHWFTQQKDPWDPSLRQHIASKSLASNRKSASSGVA